MIVYSWIINKAREVYFEITHSFNKIYPFGNIIT